MKPDDARVMYASQMDEHGETLAIRRYSGSTTSRTHADRSCRGRIMGYTPEELVGPVVQGDRKVIVLAQDLEGESPPFVPALSDKVVVRGAELGIRAIDDSTRRIGSTLIAYELQCRG